MSDPCPIVRAFGGAPVGFECETCSRLHLVYRNYSQQPVEDARLRAVECCGPWTCEKHAATLKRGQSCNACSKEQREAKEAAEFAAATKVALVDYTGEYLYRDGFGREGFFSVDDVADMRAMGKCPEWANGCYADTVSESDCDLTDHVAECILGDHHEDAYDYVDTDKVAQASKLIFEACSEVKSFTSSTTVVLLGEPKS